MESMKFGIFVLLWTASVQKTSVFASTVENEVGHVRRQGRCLLDVKEVTPRKIFQLENEILNITLEAYNRPGHRLLTEAFRIFLNEVLGYSSVSVVTFQDNFNASAVLRRLGGVTLADATHEGRVHPEAMINLGVWLPPDVEIEDWSHVENCGHLGFAGSRAFVISHTSLGKWRKYLYCGLQRQTNFVGFAMQTEFSLFGWFIPRSPLTTEHPTVDYWRTFRNNTKIASMFALRGEDLELVKRLSKDESSGSFYCNESYCEGGVFEPQRCKDVRHSKGSHACAILLTSYPEKDLQSSHFLKDHIKELDLHVKIMYLGPHLHQVVHYLADKYSNSSTQALMFFAWKPSLVTTGLHTLSISFPPCNLDLYCNYESRKLQKIVWNRLKETKPAYEAVHRVTLIQEEYLSMLNLYRKEMRRNKHSSIQDIACKWLNTEGVWRQWTVNLEDEKTKLYIGGIFPMGGHYPAPGISVEAGEKVEEKRKFWSIICNARKGATGLATFANGMSFAIVSAFGNLPFISPYLVSARMAQEAVNKNDSILKDYQLELFAYDGQCRADMVMKSFIDYIRLPEFSQMVGILGPACSDTVEPLAGVARHFRTVVISYSAEGSSFSDRKAFPYFFRTIGENKQYQYVYLHLFKLLGWARIASLTEEGQKYAEYVSHLHDLLQEKGIAFVVNRKFPRDRTALNMSQYLQDLRAKKAKIIIGDFYDHAARAVMCEAYKQKMTAKEGYVWFLPTWFIPKWYDTDSINVPGKEVISCNTSEMIQAINGHFSLQYAYFAKDDYVMQENITVKEWRTRYTGTCEKWNQSVSDYAGYAYDAVWTYAYALERLLRQNHSHIADLHSYNTTTTFVKILNETDFNGVSGHIKFAGGPSRVSMIHVVQWVNSSKTVVGSFFPKTANDSNEILDGELELNSSAIVWFTEDNLKPDDGTEHPQPCVLQTLASALDVTCEIAIVIVNVMGFSILGLVLVMCFFVIKRRYDRRVQMTEDYFKALGIDLSVTSVSALDKWEIPRDRVVINRKLGEGAFGTVYGGECFFDDKGWVAVAVKTLKVGSSCEQKLDFLSEAEVMKRFEHKNIVKLLGVCTKSEPVYTIMEFMLYGDLKTYLLARRHLVNERNCEESDEISSKRLTSMALDVARALSYLAELKYVHRDVACRNCLVNLSRVVKLGDFGMTRPMYENDYYRFNRKGMLPVRWMAPESLALGIFTPMSDVWSFGVLLYEIVTFGSFPFQGLSNNQVLEEVKSGATISIPTGVKPQLESLLRSCWALEPQRRPHASEIVEFLANNPRIVSPCLDMPLASVQLEGTDQLEIQIPDRVRKATSKSVSKTRAIRSLSDKETGANAPELIPLTPNGHSAMTPSHNQLNNHPSPYVTLQHDSDLA